FIRAAYSTDGLTNFWTTGAAGSGAIKYVNAGPAGASYTTVTPGQGIPALSTSVGGSQVLGLAGSNLVFSDDGEVNISGLDAFPGAPQANVATANIVYTGSPADFAFSPDLNTVYIADNGPAISGGTGYGGGIQRWDLVGGAYTYSYNLEDTTGAGTNGIRGMTAVFPTNSTGWGQGIYGAVIYATTSETAANRLIRFADTSGVSSAPPTLLATAGTNQFLRGVRFGPLAQPISFVSAPQSLTTCGNENVTFTAVASGNPTLGFQWQSNGVSIGGFTQTNLGANVQSTLTLTNVLVSSSGIYTAIVTNGVQSNSAQASLTVISPSGAPTLISDVQTTNIVQPVGEPVVLSVVACGAPASYQWQLNGTNLANNGHVSGAQTSTLTIANTQLSDSGNYQLVLTNASGTNYSSTVSLTVTLIGFNNGADWAVNGGATITNGVLTLSDGGLSEARSSYLNERVDILAFLASWTYQDVGAGAADGIVFVVQNSAAGTAALGGTGGNLGYLGVTNSVGLEFNIYTPNTVGIGLGTNGAGTGAGPFAPTTPVNLASGDPIGVALHYLNGNATLTLTDAVAAVSFTTNFAVNVPGLVGGNTAYVGFSGGTGGATSTQTVSNFFFTTLPVVAVQNAAGNTLILTWPAGAPGFTLQQTSSLSNPVWTTLTNIPTVVNGQNQVTLTPSGNTEFYRLIIQ
ncbi:MAG TPA: immunoglobulin domain-containing protein, partial [Candidatus Saccharimonadales bacterium]|nr:immunoglobulin domain-containing protein [Candidatus Saccharimonadales bacterium]